LPTKPNGRPVELASTPAKACSTAAEANGGMTERARHSRAARIVDAGVLAPLVAFALAACGGPGAPTPAASPVKGLTRDVQAARGAVAQTERQAASAATSGP
jgi:hypothetical protein